MALNSVQHNGQDFLHLVLQAVYMIQYCRDPATAKHHPGYHPVDAIVGELDWIAEYRYLLEEVFRMQENSNAYQVGGDHYRKANPTYQHWDVVADFNMNYFTANATKYVARWRSKHGVADVRKACHYIQKLTELHETNRGRYNWMVRAAEIPTLNDKLFQWFYEQGLTPLEQTIVTMAILYQTSDELAQLRQMLAELLQQAEQQVASGVGRAVQAP